MNLLTCICAFEYANPIRFTVPPARFAALKAIKILTNLLFGHEFLKCSTFDIGDRQLFYYSNDSIELRLKGMSEEQYRTHHFNYYVFLVQLF